jgi:hypothetical protein
MNQNDPGSTQIRLQVGFAHDLSSFCSSTTRHPFTISRDTPVSDRRILVLHPRNKSRSIEGPGKVARQINPAQIFHQYLEARACTGWLTEVLNKILVTTADASTKLTTADAIAGLCQGFPIDSDSSSCMAAIMLDVRMEMEIMN